MENLDPLRQKPDFEKLLRSIGHGVISRSIALKLCEHVWTNHVEPLQSRIRELEEENKKLKWTA